MRMLTVEEILESVRRTADDTVAANAAPYPPPL
jgi:hypothetical protein